MFRHEKTDSFFGCSSAINHSTDFSSTQYRNAVTEFKYYIKIFNYADNCYAFFLLLIQKLINNMRGIDIHTSSRKCYKKNFWILCDFSSYQNFLYITT